MSRVEPPASEGVFRLRTVAILLAVGIVGFLGMLVLGAYAPDMKSGRNGGAHALSNAATGYSALIQLAAATGREPRIIRDPNQFGDEDLLVITPEDGEVDISRALARGDKPTLVVLPKWATAGDPDHAGWVRYAGLDPAFVPEGVMNPAHKVKIARHRSGGAPLIVDTALPAEARFAAPRPLQVIAGVDRAALSANGGKQAAALQPLITDGQGGVVLGKFEGLSLYVLADPDLLSNKGMRDERQAVAALAMLDWINPSGGKSIGFDVTLNGLGKSPSPLKLAFEPPFVAMTLAVAAALLLAGLHALGQFGAPLPPERAIAFGKAALVDNTAALIRKAGRQARLGGRYAAAVRDRARVAFGVPARAQGAAVDAALDELPGRRRFTDLAAAAAGARDTHDLLAAARALSVWRFSVAEPRGAGGAAEHMRSEA